MVVAVLALVVANSPAAPLYFEVLHRYVGGLSVLHWINDGLMAVFFLLVGLEIKRELIEGQLSTRGQRILPGIGAVGGMVVPAAVYIAVNRQGGELGGWAIPTATDIAFALGVLSLFGSRVPASLKVFLTALAIIDDLGAVVVIALFYTAGVSLAYLGGSAIVVALLAVLNRRRVNHLAPYLVLGTILWFLVLKSGIHATLAGVVLALTVPLRTPDSTPPLIRLERGIHKWVAFLVVPIFGFANAGVSFTGTSLASFAQPVPLGVALGLLLGKQLGVFGACWIAVRARIASLPDHATWMQFYGVSLLCGIGFTMSLFIGLLAFASPDLQDQTKIGVIAGSAASAVLGGAVIMFAGKGSRKPAD